MPETVDKMKIYALSETAIVIEFGKKIEADIHKRVKAFVSYIEKHSFQGFIETVPAYSSVTVFYDPLQVIKGEANRSNVLKSRKSAFDIVSSLMNEFVIQANDAVDNLKRVVEIPVCYGGTFGPDLQFVAEQNNLTSAEVINIHSQGEYPVYMIGFAPGFPYLGGMSKKIATPRRSSPRTSIPKGSVGIAGNQTGVYPISTPGGWQLIGRTPIQLFLPEDDRPSFLQPGDIIKFVPISQKEFEEYKEGPR